MAARSLAGLDRRRLRLWLGAFFAALAVPAAVLVWHSSGQLKWEAFHQHRLQAEALTVQVDARLARLVEREERRSFSDYAYLVVRADGEANYLGRSRLSDFPVDSEIPGLIGYFQIDPGGSFSTPLLPAAALRFELSERERRAREDVERRIRGILAENQLVAPRPRTPAAPERVAESALASARVSQTDESAEERERDAMADAAALTSQTAFDQLATAVAPAPAGRARVEDLKLAERYVQESEPRQPPAARAPRQRLTRKEVGASPAAAPLERNATAAGVPITTFESELDPFEFRRLESGHFVLFRRVLRDGQLYVQGLLLDALPFLDGTLATPLRGSALSQMSDVIAAYGGDVLSTYSGDESVRYFTSAPEPGGELLYRSRLAAPFGALEMVYRITRLPAGPGARVLASAAAALALVLCGGFYLLYRLALGQIELARQQQDFVSAVSHELKTPLTSIRMYGEMLREGWASEEKKRTYYDYIFHESERLSRLIGNVLQLARMTRNDLEPELTTTTAGNLVEQVVPKIVSQVERAGFALEVDCAGAAAIPVRADEDFASQILINLVDNALKFSAKAERKTIVLGCRAQPDGSVVLTVRDHGPGVQRDQMRKIFRLFYRSENELTRETVGTGIGLSLVHQLALAMGGKADVINRDPGAEFRVHLPAASDP